MGQKADGRSLPPDGVSALNGGCRADDIGLRMGGRAVEGTGLENRQGRESLVGSNPTPSAIPL